MAGNSRESDDLDDFLRRVNELEAVVNDGLTVSSGDASGASSDAAAVENTVKLENKQPVNRTVINKDAFRSPPAPTPGSAVRPSENQSTDISQDGFMKAVERDAAERAEKRKEGLKRATDWKDRGNREFKAGNYEKAVELYTQGLTHLRDFGLLYTNRAQAYNKLGMFQTAIDDCDLILRLEPKNSKAHIHRGKALLGLLQYDEAMASYKEILKYDPKKTRMVEEYMTDATQARIAAEAERKASQKLEGGDMHSKTVIEVLEKLWRAGQNLMYYAGGMRVLGNMLQDDTARTLFRTGKGFSLLSQDAINRCVSQVVEGEKKVETVEVVLALLDVLTEAVLQNDENCKVLLETTDFPATFLGLLGSSHLEVAHLCVALLLRLTESSSGRMHAVSSLDNASLLVGLFAFVQTSHTGASQAAKVLNNLALEKRFTSQFSNKVDSEVLPAFEKFLTHSEVSKKDGVFPSCISFIGNMAHDPVIRKQIARRREFWEAANTVLRVHIEKLSQPASREVVYTMLGLLLNVTMETTQALKDQSQALCSQTLPLLKSEDRKMEERAAGLLARLLPHSPGAVQEACQAGLPSKLLQALHITDLEVECQAAYSRCLAVITKTSEEARAQVVDADPNLRHFLSLLTSTNHSIVANVALSIGHCVEVTGVSERLADTDLVKTLLAKTDTTNESIKENCAITLAKLATSNQRHLDRLRELGGIGILHSCSKYALR